MAQIGLKRFIAVILAFTCPLVSVSAEGKAKAGGELAEVPAGTFLSIELVDPIHTGKNKAGDVFRGRVLEAVYSKNHVVVAPGTTVRGELLEVERSGRIKQRAKLALTLRSLQVDASTIAVKTDTLSYLGDKHGGKNIGSMLGGALQGAFFGLLLGGSDSAGVGAGVGAGAGVVQGLIRGKEDLEFTQGARLLFETLGTFQVPKYPTPERREPPLVGEEAGKPSS